MTGPKQRRTAHSEKSAKGATSGTSTEKTPVERKDGLRETVESIVVAFILAFLFRAFEAEAFVIPTGSMAPTLYGRHKDVNCEQCGYSFTVGASDEVDDYGLLRPGHRIEEAACPNCRYRMSVFDLPVFKGDRILVNKFPYEFSDPSRWDVAVFKYPEEPKTNYIKRLVGLPNETVMIKQGDLYLIEPDGTRSILRKEDPTKQRDLQILVYDNDHPETTLHKNGWPTRWAAVKRSNGTESIAGWTDDADGWQADENATSFALSPDKSAGGDMRWLRYRHIIPTNEDWLAVDFESDDSGASARTPELRQNPSPQLITDLCGYNTYTGGQSIGLDALYSDYYWVGDLTLSATVDVTDVREGAEIVFELCEGSRRYRCRIDVNTGNAELLTVTPRNREEVEETVMASCETGLNGVGDYRVVFANVDDRLCLWINGTLAEFGEGAKYVVPETTLAGPQNADLIPAGIASRGLGATVSHLLLERDIYYRSEYVVENDFSGQPAPVSEVSARERLLDLIYDPLAWSDHYYRNMNEAVFELGPDEYLMLGDNSPRSKDSRLWTNTRRAKHRHAVSRTALVGKAFFIYWPHGKPFGIPLISATQPYGYPVTYHTLNAGHGRDGVASGKSDYPDFRFPFYPQIGRMHRIR